METVSRKRRAMAMLAACMGLALGGCVLVPRPDPVAEDVFRAADGTPVEVPWEWAR